MSDHVLAVHETSVTENHICIIGEVDFHTLDPWCRCGPSAVEFKRDAHDALLEVTILHRNLREQGYIVAATDVMESVQAILERQP